MEALRAISEYPRISLLLHPPTLVSPEAQRIPSPHAVIQGMGSSDPQFFFPPCFIFPGFFWLHTKTFPGARKAESVKELLHALLPPTVTVRVRAGKDLLRWRK
jgi:hypothetical protein